MKILKNDDIIQLMKEEWNAKLAVLSETIGLDFNVKVDGREIEPIDDELKIRSKKNRILYTIKSVGPQKVVMLSPEGDEIIVDKDKLKKSEGMYELD